ncbi:MAG: hypothetical protein AB1476_06760 [Candidatus Hadarchaeota archaeon]
MAELCSKCGKKEGHVNFGKKWVCRECEVELKVYDYIGGLDKLPDIEQVTAVLGLSAEEISKAVDRSPVLKSIVFEKCPNACNAKTRRGGSWSQLYSEYLVG